MFNIYSASAGSGKTYNLVFDYLTICFKPHLSYFLKMQDRQNYSCKSCSEYRSVLAITFTNNAGAEMKNRIVKQLKIFAFAESLHDVDARDFDFFCSKLFGNIDVSRDDAFIFIQRNSKALLRDIVYDYSQFSVTTIDSFMQRIVRASAVYLGLNVNYSVLIDLFNFYNYSVEQYISTLLPDSFNLKVAINEMSQEMNDNGRFNFRQFLRKNLSILYEDLEKSHNFIKNSHDLTYLREVQKLWTDKFFELERAYPSVRKECSEPIIDEARKIFAEAANAGLKVNGNTKWNEKFEKLGSNESWLNLPKKGESLLLDNSIPLIFNKCSSDLESLKEDIQAKLEELFSQIKSEALKFASQYFKYDDFIRNSNNLLVFNELRKFMTDIKMQTDSFFLSETNPLIYDEVCKESQGDVLFEKMSCYKHFFIDEFQDTSQMQWEDLKPLLNNALSRGGSVTLFGDVKQSIYRFRNGDVRLFYNMLDYSRFCENEVMLSHVLTQEQFKQIPLDTNYRSLSNIVEFNNRFFQFYSDIACCQKYYKEVAQKSVPSKSGGYVRLSVVYNDSEPIDISDLYSNCAPKQEIPKEYTHLLYDVYDALKRGYNYGDMMVLFSSKKDCIEFAQVLMRCKIPVITSESMYLNDNAAVNVVINTLRLFVSPANSLAQSVILRYLSDKNGCDFAKLIDNSSNFAENSRQLCGENILELLPEWSNEPLLIAVKNIISFYDFDDSYSPFITDFLDLLADFIVSSVATPENFLKYWDELLLNGKNPKLVLQESQNAINVMTVHKAKGLEAPVVLTMCNPSKNGGADGVFWIEDSETNVFCPTHLPKSLNYTEFVDIYEQEQQDKVLDSLNKWYVDFTRARDVLYIVAKSNNKKNTKSKRNTDSDSASIGKTLKKFAADSMSEAGEDIYEFGDNAHVNPKRGEQHVSTKKMLKKAYSNINFYTNDRLSVSDSDEDGDEARKLGTDVHAILQKMYNFPRTSDDVEAVCNKVPSDLRNTMSKIFGQIANEDEWAPYFFVSDNDKVRNEVEIVTAEGSILRPDRVVIKPDHVMVIDYKTGKRNDKLYQAQLAKYKQNIERMGYNDVRTEILYLNI